MELLAARFGLPHVPAILQGVGKLWYAGTLLHDIQVSSARWMAGWAIGSTIGVALGLLTGRHRAAGLTLEGLLTLCRAIPFISLVPLSIRIFGITEAGKIFLVAWACAGVCWVVVHQASRAVPAHLLWRAQSLGATTEKWVFQVLLPSCHDGVFAGLRASLGLGLIVVAVAELAGVYERSSGRWWSEGLGYRLFRSLDEARDDLMLAAILTFALLGIAGDQLFVGLWKAAGEAWFRWRQWRVRALAEQGRAAGAAEGDALTGRLIEGPQMAAELKSAGAEGDALMVRGLRSGYGGHTVLRDLSLDVPAGSTLSVVGPSGCGKTTLIRAIGHFIDGGFEVSGGVLVGGEAIHAPGPEVGVVLQDAPVFDHMTVWDNVLFGSSFDDEDTARASRRVWALLRQFGLEPLAEQRAGTLSGGQRQRLALAAALANRPKLLLLDEPFGALDAITRRQLQRFFWEHLHGRVTAVFVTHDLEEALLIGDRVAVGVGRESQSLDVDKNGLPPHEWERGPAFSRLRADLIAHLEGASAGLDTPPA